MLAHLDASVPTMIVQELHAKLLAVSADVTSAHKAKGAS
jgi:hypothetical protein